MGERLLLHLLAHEPVVNHCWLRYAARVWQSLRARPRHGMMLSGNMR